MKNLLIRILLLVSLVTNIGTAAFAASEPYIGTIQSFGFNFCPRGWAEANGTLLDISQNTALFSLFGTMYGGDGRITFGLPDLRGRAPIGAGTGSGLSPRTEGAKGGAERVTLTVAQIPSHNHSFVIKAGRGVKTNTTNAFLGESGIYRTSGSNLNLNSSVLTNVGGSQPHENMPPYQVVKYCVALVGLFPSRS